MKSAENDYFDQRLGCAAPKRWSKYTTDGWVEVRFEGGGGALSDFNDCLEHWAKTAAAEKVSYERKPDMNISSPSNLGTLICTL